MLSWTAGYCDLTPDYQQSINGTAKYHSQALELMAQSTTNRDQMESESERATESPSEPVAQAAPDGPSPPDWPSMDEREELLWEDSPSFKYFLLDLMLNILIVGIGVTLATIGALQLLDVLPANIRLAVIAFGGAMMVIGIVFLLVNYRSYQRKHYALTTEAIYRRWDGSTTRIEIENVSKILCEQSWLDRQFSCGDLKVAWCEDEKNEIIYPAVPHPDQVKKRLSELGKRDNWRVRKR